MSRVSVLWPLFTIAVATQLFASAHGQVDRAFSMREVLTLAEIGPARLSELPKTEEFVDDDWQVVLQVVGRLEQFRDRQGLMASLAAMPTTWLEADSTSVGEVFELKGKILSVEKKTLSAALQQITETTQIYQCRFRFADTNRPEPQLVDLISSHVPRAWLTKREFDEDVVVRGVLLNPPTPAESQPARVLTDHIAWYPNRSAPTGQILLARQGMDVALLDEVRHRQPFVKASVSREGEAFYAALKALRAVASDELRQLAKENVVRVAQQWKSRQPELQTEYQQTVAILANATNEQERRQRSRAKRQAKTRRDLGITIARQAQKNQSSVATMFLQPEKEVGELFYFEGTARRAVWIAAEEDSDLAGYYEMEVYPIEARLLDNRPVVCCVSSLPADFPTGDRIREPVQIAGIFFKSWRYRSRELNQQQGKTDEPRQLYTPVLIGKSPIWLTQTSVRERPGALLGGVAFIVALVAVWAAMAWLSKHDRRARRALRPTETIDIEPL